LLMKSMLHYHPSLCIEPFSMHSCMTKCHTFVMEIDFFVKFLPHTIVQVIFLSLHKEFYLIGLWIFYHILRWFFPYFVWCILIFPQPGSSYCVLNNVRKKWFIFSFDLYWLSVKFMN
jgi:hypothetical protein